MKKSFVFILAFIFLFFYSTFSEGLNGGITIDARESWNIRIKCGATSPGLSCISAWVDNVDPQSACTYEKWEGNYAVFKCNQYSYTHYGICTATSPCTGGPVILQFTVGEMASKPPTTSTTTARPTTTTAKSASTTTTINCPQYTDCPSCINSLITPHSCGWCADGSGSCKMGNKNGPFQGNCNSWKCSTCDTSPPPSDPCSRSENTIDVWPDGQNRCTDIQKAINNAQSGDVIFVHGGTYRPKHFGNPTRALEIKKSIKLKGESKEKTIIDAGEAAFGIYIEASDVFIEELTIQNAKQNEKFYSHGDREANIYVLNGKNVNIQNNLIKSCSFCGGGIMISNSKTTINDNTIKENSGSGIYISQNSQATITGNTIERK